MDAVLYQGSQKDREEIRKYEFGYVSRKNVKGHKVQIVITTPETAMVPDRKSSNGRALCRALSAIQWDVIVVDEGERGLESLCYASTRGICFWYLEASAECCLLMTPIIVQFLHHLPSPCNLCSLSNPRSLDWS